MGPSVGSAKETELESLTHLPVPRYPDQASIPHM